MAKILLVEDYPSLQQIYKETLELDGHIVYVAANIDDALKVTQNTQVDIILLDLLLQQTWGLDLLKSFDPKEHPATKIIIISNLYTNKILNDALKLGAIHYLIKSDITPQKLIEVVRDTLTEAALHPPKSKNA